ncbi:serine hydrolase [Robiginitalea sp. SC105]|uniref:serine hydrolase domain-containing protein n=1 Tax=Robiginitalea sp. SC105 TaxID=2762332 RepID=UPI001639F380|nr:serine hydrolase domain-containing protein [Robiginitalea sp. SC105]MBC2839304.1 serine hydrolase [Robiginitalea sp. SC105]
MIRNTLIALLTLASGLSCPVQSQAGGLGQSQAGGKGSVLVATDPRAVLADNYLEKLTALHQFNGVVLLRAEGELLLRKAYNMPSKGLAHLAVTPESRFDLRSVAKLFAKAAVLQLEAGGQLKRSDTIGSHLPGFPNGGEITIRHLMDHSSGLPREFNDSLTNLLDKTPRELVALAALEPLEFKPGTREQYSNVGYQLLYRIIGKYSGDETFSAYLQEHFFSPLGMEASGSNFGPDTTYLSNYAYGHYEDRDGSLRCEDRFPPDDLQQGNLHATVDDLDRFLSWLAPGKHAGLAAENRISHAGGTRGKRAYVERSFEPDYQLVFLANYDGIPFEQLVTDLRLILAGGELPLPERVERKAVAVAPEILSRYEGTYDFVEAGHLILDLKLEQDSLRVYQKGQYNGVLYPESERVFFGDPNSAESLEFVPDPDGRYFILMDFQGVRWKGIRISGGAETE